ncbi:F-box/WD repeat-containing protein 9 [Xyrauchen texanus]|uniref:F-box/WD repeat-containing protein 9 n=1 Tax=Xyrauchen texanus TaxID=154827 RepID=UPI0022418F71|nr:F-box/WD repeat-containing protein 9 [Xyrauchen texanus]XP_051995982.1 F-box/WD repeat-containing protein 9 [Xyrauchen texanus]
MSKPNVTLEEEETKRCSAGTESEVPPNLNCNDTPRAIPDRLKLEPSIIATETSPSPSSNGTSLLSLPWEIVTQIASHLPAQCVINVLPKVCQMLGRVGEDRLVWQVRAHKLSGPGASFPVGPKEDFDWSTACLEMEQLIGSWTGQGDQLDGQEEREIHHEELAGAVGGVNGEVQEAGGNVEEMQVDVDRNGDEMRVDVQEDSKEPPKNIGEREARVEDGAQNDSNSLQRLDCEGTPSSSSSSPLERIILPSGHIADVNCVLLLGGEGALCASGSRDRNVNIWDLRQGPRGALMHTLGAPGVISTHRGWVWCLASSGPLLASGSFDSTIRLWDLEAEGAELGLIKCKAAVLCMACERDTVLAGTHDQKLSIFDTRAADPLVKSLHLHSDAVLCLTSNDNYILSGSKDQTIALFDRRAGKLLQKVQLNSYLLSLCYSGREVWAGDNRGLVHTFSMHNSSLTPTSQFNIHTSLVTGVHYSPGTLYTCSSDRTIKIHLPCAPPKTLCTLHHQAGVNGLSFEAGTLAIASGDMNVAVWRPRT